MIVQLWFWHVQLGHPQSESVVHARTSQADSSTHAGPPSARVQQRSEPPQSALRAQLVVAGRDCSWGGAVDAAQATSGTNSQV